MFIKKLDKLAVKIKIREEKQYPYRGAQGTLEKC